jgi:Ca-activated chloride channel family protein
MKISPQALAPIVAALIFTLGIAAASKSPRTAAVSSGQNSSSGQAASKASKGPKGSKTPSQKPPEVGQLKREVRLVNVVFSVLNKQEHFVTDLGQKDFEVFDNNIPQHVEFFSRETDLPLRIGLLMDTSNSIRPRLQFEKNAAFDFLFDTIRPGKDLAFLMTFDTEPQLQQGFTDNLDLLRQAVDEQRAGGGTALYDAIYDASRDYLMNPPLPASGNENVRRVLIVISDGYDDLSNHARSTALDMAERAGVVIYTISSSRDWLSADQKIAEGLPFKLHYNAGDKVLQEFSADTGGRAFFPSDVNDLAQAFANIGTELRTEYSIAYTPSNGANNGKFHRIQIEILGHHGLTVRSRRGYFAPTATGTPMAASQN